MAGMMRKAAVYLGLVEEDLEADYTDEEPRPRPRESYQSSAPQTRPRPVADAPAPSVVPAATPPLRTATAVAERPAAGGSSPTPPATPVPAPAGAQVNRPTVTSTMRATSSDAGAETYRITTLHPRSYNDARRIGEEYREGVPVIVNLTGMEDADAKRIVDFAAGLIFGLRGSIERVTNKVFLLSPANVDVGAEARAQIAQDGFFNQS
jgi:cell division inhibitor SepF